MSFLKGGSFAILAAAVVLAGCTRKTNHNSSEGVEAGGGVADGPGAFSTKSIKKVMTFSGMVGDLKGFGPGRVFANLNTYAWDAGSLSLQPSLTVGTSYTFTDVDRFGDAWGFSSDHSFTRSSHVGSLVKKGLIVDGTYQPDFYLAAGLESPNGDLFFSVDTDFGIAPPLHALYRSRDGGATWTQLESHTSSITPQKILEDSQGHLYVFLHGYVTDTGGDYYSKIRKSTDRGDTWTEVYSTKAAFFSDAFIAPDDSVTVAIGGLADGTRSLIRSSDGGATWSAPLSVRVTAAAAQTIPGYTTNAFTRFTRGRDGAIYLALTLWGTNGTDGIRDHLLRGSLDGGKTWNTIFESNPTLATGGNLCSPSLVTEEPASGAIFFSWCDDLYAVQDAVPTPQAKTLTCQTSAQAGGFTKLSDTCLTQVMANEKSGQFAYANFFKYDPPYPLRSLQIDAKGRWIYLPPGTKINNADPDNWSYPQGTILWKEFSAAGVRIETRMLEKTAAADGSASWKGSVFYWRADQTDADFFPDDEFPTAANLKNLYAYERYLTRDAAGVISAYTYKIPAASACVNCHAGARDMAMGFNGLQLTDAIHGLKLPDLVQKGLLTNTAVTYAVLGTDRNKKVIGFLSTNCASCHSPFNTTAIGTVANARVSYKFVNGGATPADQLPLKDMIAKGIYIQGDQANSRIITRMNGTTGAVMPPALDGLLQQDEAASQLVSDWVAQGP